MLKTHHYFMGDCLKKEFMKKELTIKDVWYRLRRLTS